MGGIALLARALGHRVTGADAGVYPPMSTMLAEQGIAITEGYNSAVPAADIIVIGNALSRGNPAVEAVLDRGLPYTSGPQWLAEHVLAERWVLAVAGTHGKTTTSSLLAWILDQAGLEPGFLIGGVAHDFGVSARLGSAPFFVVEADEYDSAFFDKRSKFIHYRPRTLVINNLEFDHADIFENLAAIQRQVHHCVRTVPGTGRIIVPADDANVDAALALGVWTPVEHIGLGATTVDGALRARLDRPDGSAFALLAPDRPPAPVHWGMLGRHNVANATAAAAAARHAGVPVEVATDALARFAGVRRRLEIRGERAGVTVYDDFAHHPTAIRVTLDALRKRVGGAPITAVLEPRSNTMRLGVQAGELARALEDADRAFVFEPAGLRWSLREALAALGERARVFDALDPLVAAAVEATPRGGHLLVMSNGGFGGIHARLLERLAEREATPGV